MAAINPTPPNLTKQQILKFCELIDRSPGQGPTGECWEWKGLIATHGYGIFSSTYRHYRASRLVYWLWRGEWPELNICHKCDNPKCCRPRHLYPATQRENILDCIRKGRCKLRIGGIQDMPRSTRNGNGRLTREQVIEIRQIYELGFDTQPEIARRYGVKLHTIAKIVGRQTWRRI